jgi:glycosyltransferase involved in cell wall biosynthesis
VLQSTDGVAAIGDELDAADAALPRNGPLVSIVVPTYNRRERLRGALQSVANQHYDSVEMVVVNDGGVDIADIVASFPRARLIENGRNLGVTPSVNAGIAAARGEYLCFLADDDFLQPDHVARLVAALECSKADVAHSKELALHHEAQPDGSYSLCGHHVGAPIPTHPDDMLVSNRIGGPSVMVRRRALDAVGSFDAAMRHGSDFEMWMRLSRTRDFVFVNHVTAHLFMRNDNSQLSSVSGAETAEIMKRIYDKHPVAERLLLETARTQALAICAEKSVVRSVPVCVLNEQDRRELGIG